MDINKYKLFVTVAETRSISYSAELMGYTQSAVSHSMKRLEKELSIQLFSRDRYGVHLTPVGYEVLREVRKLLVANEQFEQFVYSLKGIEVGTVTIGTFPSISVSLLPQIINDFSELHPNITINIRESGTGNIDAWVRNHQVDFSFCNQLRTADLDFIPLCHDQYMAIFPKSFEPAKHMDVFPVEEFVNYNFIMSEKSYDHNIYDILADSGISPSVRYTSQNDYAIMSMVEHKIGLSILPELIIEQRKDFLNCLPLDPPRTRTLGILLRGFHELSPAARIFLLFVMNHFDVPADTALS